MALLNRVRIDAFGESATDVEAVFDTLTGLLREASERQCSVVQEVIQLDAHEGPRMAFSGRRILAFDISEVESGVPVLDPGIRDALKEQ